MEMSYDGTLVMPKSYAVMDQEEMCYVEGGGIKVGTMTVILDVGLIIIPCFASVNAATKAGKLFYKAVQAAGMTKKKVVKGIRDLVYDRTGKLIKNSVAERIVDAFWTATGLSIGYIIAEGIDLIDGKNNGICFG